MSGGQVATGEGADGGGDAHDLFLGQFGEHREREDARGLSFGLGGVPPGSTGSGAANPRRSGSTPPVL